MNKVIYIQKLIPVDNGQCLFDKRLSTSLQEVYKKNIEVIKLSKINAEITRQLSHLDNPETLIILSHLFVFKLAPNFKKSPLIFIHHDLPYYAYYKAPGLVNKAKALYSFVYIKFFQRYSDFDFFLSKREVLLQGAAKASKSGRIYLGMKPGSSSEVNCNSLSDKVIFTGNYLWSLKKRALINALRKGYHGKLNLISVNPDSFFKTNVEKNGIKIQYQQEYFFKNELAIGVITDDFISGFKLKALEFIRMQCCVASFCDLKEEFDDIPHSEIFIRKINCLDDLDKYFNDLQYEPKLFEKFQQFYRVVYDKYSWASATREIAETISSLPQN